VAHPLQGLGGGAGDGGRPPPDWPVVVDRYPGGLHGAPAEAGVQQAKEMLDSRMRGNDKADTNLSNDGLILIGGSTSWNEEEVLLRVFGRLKKTFHSLQLILAPRHPERLGKVIQEIEKHGFQYQLYSQNLSAPSEVVVIDRMGILASLYSFADVVFIGGSLVTRGGQNPIEAAASKKPVLHGPNVFNFEDIYQKLDESLAAFPIKSEEELFQKLDLLLKQPHLCRETGERAWAIVQSMKGATARTLKCLDRFVQSRNSVPVFAEKV
jgi:3-deoxy-D-manno-octulosonic-acid transferase